MKIKNQIIKNEIQKIFIEKESFGVTKISLIVNNQLIEMYTKNDYIDEIFDKINEYMKVIGSVNYVRI